MKDYVIIDGVRINDDDLSFIEIPYLDGTKEFGSSDITKQIHESTGKESESFSSSLSSFGTSGAFSFRKENKDAQEQTQDIKKHWYLINDKNKKLFGLASKELNMFIDLEPVKTHKDFVSLLKNLQETPNIYFNQMLFVLQEVVEKFMGKKLQNVLTDRNFVGEWQQEIIKDFKESQVQDREQEKYSENIVEFDEKAKNNEEVEIFCFNPKH